MEKEKALVICPGRGSYNSEELGYLHKYHPKFLKDIVSKFDVIREKNAQIPISELDSAAKFRPSVHTKGENASGLIFSCAYADFLDINREKYEVIAVTGNSMGWYIALACAAALNPENAFKLVNTMGSMMKEGNIGGQVIYPVMNEQWELDSERLAHVRQVMDEIKRSKLGLAYDSIYLGGNIVIGADKNGLRELLKRLEPVKIGRVEYPFQLINHAAFHTDLMRETSEKAFQTLDKNIFQKANLSLIDGLGNSWKSYSSDLAQLYQYTLGHQVYAPYDFTRAITVALKEYSPDRLILLGSGGSLGSSIAQILIQNKWRGIKSKADFIKQQKADPYLISMGRQSERDLAL